MARPIAPESRERLLNAAERLFSERGYHAVSMADIAEATGVRKASLYHHVPNGKEELFVEIASRAFSRHHEGLTVALRGADATLTAQLRAASRWLIAQAPLGLLAMLQNDMPALDSAHIEGLEQQLFQSLWLPLVGVFEEARARGEIEAKDVGLYVGAFISMMDGLTFIGTSESAQRIPGQSMEEMADELITMIIRGLEPAT